MIRALPAHWHAAFLSTRKPLKLPQSGTEPGEIQGSTFHRLRLQECPPELYFSPSSCTALAAIPIRALEEWDHTSLGS
jgi:hypothetical protein